MRFPNLQIPLPGIAGHKDCGFVQLYFVGKYWRQSYKQNILKYGVKRLLKQINIVKCDLLFPGEYVRVLVYSSMKMTAL